MLEFDDNTSKQWSDIDTVDLRYSIECGLTVAEIACFLKRTGAEVKKKAVELGMALHIEGGSGRRRRLHQCAKRSSTLKCAAISRGNRVRQLFPVLEVAGKGYTPLGSTLLAVLNQIVQAPQLCAIRRR